MKHSVAEHLFVEWSSGVNSCFYELDEFGPLKKKILDADELVRQYGMPDSASVRSKFISAYFNTLLFIMPDTKKIDPWYQQAIKNYDQIESIEDKLVLYNHLMLYDFWTGDFEHARLLYKDFLGMNLETVTNPMIHMMRFTMCAQFEWLVNMSVEQCMTYVEAGLSFAKQAGGSKWNAQLSGQAVYAYIIIPQEIQTIKYKALFLFCYDYAKKWSRHE